MAKSLSIRPDIEIISSMSNTDLIYGSRDGRDVAFTNLRTNDDDLDYVEISGDTMTGGLTTPSLRSQDVILTAHNSLNSGGELKLETPSSEYGSYSVIDVYENRTRFMRLGLDDVARLDLDHVNKLLSWNGAISVTGTGDNAFKGNVTIGTLSSKKNLTINGTLSVNGDSKLYSPLKFTSNGTSTIPNIQGVDNCEYIRVSGGTNTSDGATLLLTNKNYVFNGNNKNYFSLITGTHSGTSEGCLLTGNESGSLTWNSKNIVRSVNGINAGVDGNVTLSSLSVPVGTVIAFAGNTAPSGYLMCNGAAKSRTTYASLFSVIGTTYGSGDGSTTFNLPNMSTQLISSITNTNIPVVGNGRAINLVGGRDAAGNILFVNNVKNWAQVQLSKDSGSFDVGAEVSNIDDSSAHNKALGLATSANYSGMVANMSATKTTMRYCIKY